LWEFVAAIPEDLGSIPSANRFSALVRVNEELIEGKVETSV
jgi:hypothetical protein